MTDDGTSWIFVIDTDSYSGNFERPLASYVTGQCGETHGEAEAEIARKEIPADVLEWLDEHTVSSTDGEHGVEVGHIYATPGRSNNGNGGHYDVKPDHPYKWPAYESVAIEFAATIPDNVRVVMVERAQNYKNLAKKYEWDARPTILGFRLLRQETKTVEAPSVGTQGTEVR